jgi:hypothetical protein
VPRRGEFQGFGAPNEELDPCLILQALDLMGQGGLRDVEHVGGLLQTAGVMDGLDGAEVPELDMHM